MADFCKECAKDLFNADTNDLSGIITKEDSDAGYISSVVICEGCGPIQVDHEGSCMSGDCIGAHRGNVTDVAAATVSGCIDVPADELEHGDSGDVPLLTPHTADIEQSLDLDEDETHCGPGCDNCDCDSEETEQDGLCYECDHPLEDCECEEEQDNHCYECSQPLEDCECEPESCDDCGLSLEDCECGLEDSDKGDF